MTNEFTLTQTGSEPTTLAFADADGCARWLRALPLSNIPKHYDAIRGQLKRLSEADFTPRERARIAEVLREPVAYLHTELARRYAGKPHPATEREHEAAEQALSLWQGLWNQYSACLKPLLEGDPELQGVKAKVLQRGLWVGKQMHPGLRSGAATAGAQRLAGTARLLPAGRDSRMYGERGVRRAHAERHRRVVLLDLFARAADAAGRPVRDDRAPDRVDRPLALDVGAQGFSVRAAARDGGTGNHRRPRRTCRRGTGAGRAPPSERSHPIRLPGEARNQREGTHEAACHRRQSGGAAAWPRRFGRSKLRAARLPRFALVRAAQAEPRTGPRPDSTCALGASVRPTSASPGAPSIGRIPLADCPTMAPSTSPRSAR